MSSMHSTIDTPRLSTVVLLTRHPCDTRRGLSILLLSLHGIPTMEKPPVVRMLVSALAVVVFRGGGRDFGFGTSETGHVDKPSLQRSYLTSNRSPKMLEPAHAHELVSPCRRPLPWQSSRGKRKTHIPQMEKKEKYHQERKKNERFQEQRETFSID